MSDFFSFKSAFDAEDVWEDELPVEEDEAEEEAEPVQEVTVADVPVVTTSSSNMADEVVLSSGNPLNTDAETDAVKLLQELLNSRGESLMIDGVFGPQTNAAVRRFQRRKKMVVDGVVGPKTWAALWD